MLFISPNILLRGPHPSPANTVLEEAVLGKRVASGVTLSQPLELWRSGGITFYFVTVGHAGQGMVLHFWAPLLWTGSRSSKLYLVLFAFLRRGERAWDSPCVVFLHVAKDELEFLTFLSRLSGWFPTWVTTPRHIASPFVLPSSRRDGGYRRGL